MEFILIIFIHGLEQCLQMIVQKYGILLDLVSVYDWQFELFLSLLHLSYWFLHIFLYKY